MQCHQARLREVAAGLGTALTPDNAKQLRRFGVPIFLVFDGDEAGRKAAERAAETLLAEQVDGAVVLLPPGQDPADVVAGGGRGPIDAAVEGAHDLWTYRMERALARHGTTTLAGREKAAKELMGVVSRIGDAVRRELAFRWLAERTGVPESTLRSEVRAPRGGPGAAAVRSEPASSAWVEAERHVLRATLEDTALWDRVELWYPLKIFDLKKSKYCDKIQNLKNLEEIKKSDRCFEIQYNKPANRRAPITIKNIWEKPFEWFIPQREDCDLYVRTRKGYHVHVGTSNLKWKGTTGNQEIYVDTSHKYLLVRNKPTFENPYGEAMLSVMYWSYFYDKQNFMFWLKFLESTANQRLVGKSNSDDLANMAEKLSTLIQHGVAAVSAGDTIDAIQPAGNGEIYEKFRNLIEKVVWQYFTGRAPLANLTSGSRAGQESENELLTDIKLSDANLR